MCPQASLAQCLRCLLAGCTVVFLLWQASSGKSPSAPRDLGQGPAASEPRLSHLLSGDGDVNLPSRGWGKDGANNSNS